MAKKIILVIIVALVLILIFKMTNNVYKMESKDAVGVDAVYHGSVILHWGDAVIYADPSAYKSEKADLFAGKPDPDMILITDIHQDHLDVDTLTKISKEKTIIIAPMAVADMLPATIPGTLLVLKNGLKTDQLGFSIEAIPMYNLPESDTSYHTKGRGNGYVIEKNNERVYISGDTSGIPEMKNLKDIDMAFVAMNLPFTMGVEEAAEAVLACRPKQV
jgi:L-ascorbate metabolism protein UlaG (beta-lactamase superfamily)